MNRPLSISVLFILICFSSLAQNFYPQNYFTYPLQAPAGMVANFGELRPNHFHMGLDCQTLQKENIPVLAAADGYIAKVKIEPFGFGRAIYINHPNGLTTLYAHLNNFYPELEQYVRARQYEMKTWALFIDLKPDMFKVRKGEVIAFSGNSGGSQGPHLHFEIRDTRTDKVLNPLLFNFPFTDHKPPVIQKIALYDRSFSSYTRPPFFLGIKKISANSYNIPGIVTTPFEKISFGISATDTYDGSSNPNGIYKASLYDNGVSVSTFTMDSISYDETRYLNAHIDFSTRSRGGPFIQHLSRLPGYINSIYSGPKSEGILQLEEGDIHNISIDVWDTYGNKSRLDFRLQLKNKQPQGPPEEGLIFEPGQINVFENEDIRFYLPENALYDAFPFTYKKIVSQGKVTHQIHKSDIPLQTYFSLNIKPEKAFDDTGKIIMKGRYGTKTDFKKAMCVSGWYRADFRAFGNYELFMDTTAPQIIPLGFKNGMNVRGLTRLSFKVTDNAEDIASFKGYIDDNWVLFSNDKGSVFVYTFDTYCGSGAHELRIVATDLAGNTTERKYSFTR